MNYIKWTYPDIANGPGCRLTLWVAGCDHHCKGCHNPQTWDPDAGQPFTEETKNKIIEMLRPDYIQGLTLSGGDPLYPENRLDVLNLITAVYDEFKGEKDVWLWTGYKWEDLWDKNSSSLYDYYLTYDFKYLKTVIICYCDVIVDGEFIEEQKDISLPYCGSRNQRVIDCQKSLETGKIVLWEEK